WTIFIDTSDDGILNGNEVSQTTTSNGYSFTNLGPGTYSICEVEQQGWTRSKPANSNCQSITISNSNQTSTADFGNYQQASIVVIKHVVNPNGDPITDTSTNFNFSVTGQSAFQLTDDG